MDALEVGRRRYAARQIGISEEAYARKRARGPRWCSACHGWHPASEFGPGQFACRAGAARRARAIRKRARASLVRIQARIESQGERLAPLLAGRPEKDIRAELDRDARKTLDEFARKA